MSNTFFRRRGSLLIMTLTQTRLSLLTSVPVAAHSQLQVFSPLPGTTAPEMKVVACRIPEVTPPARPLGLHHRLAWQLANLCATSMYAKHLSWQVPKSRFLAVLLELLGSGAAPTQRSTCRTDLPL